MLYLTERHPVYLAFQRIPISLVLRFVYPSQSKEMEEPTVAHYTIPKGAHDIVPVPLSILQRYLQRR
jgi:hypothetical protein